MYASMKHLQWLPSGQRASNGRAAAAVCATVGTCCHVKEMRAVQAMYISYWVCQALSCDWVCKHHADITALMQAPASSLGMALGWARAARLRASYWTTLRVAAAVQCGCPRVSVDVSKDILLESAVLTLDAVHDVLQARICTTMRSGICTIWAAPVSASSTTWAAYCSGAILLQSLAVEETHVPSLVYTCLTARPPMHAGANAGQGHEGCGPLEGSAGGCAVHVSPYRRLPPYGSWSQPM